MLTTALQRTESLESASDFQGLEKGKTKEISGSSHCHEHTGYAFRIEEWQPKKLAYFQFFLHLEMNSYPDLNETQDEHETEDACFGKRLPVRARKVQETVAQTPKDKTGLRKPGTLKVPGKSALSLWQGTPKPQQGGCLQSHQPCSWIHS